MKVQGRRNLNAQRSLYGKDIPGVQERAKRSQAVFREPIRRPLPLLAAFSVTRAASGTSRILDFRFLQQVRPRTSSPPHRASGYGVLDFVTRVSYIRNLVCDRCIRVVREELEQLHVDDRSIELGDVVVGRRGLKAKLPAVKRALQRSGFDLVGDRRAGLVEQIKAAVIELCATSWGSRLRPSGS